MVRLRLLNSAFKKVKKPFCSIQPIGAYIHSWRQTKVFKTLIKAWHAALTSFSCAVLVTTVLSAVQMAGNVMKTFSEKKMTLLEKFKSKQLSSSCSEFVVYQDPEAMCVNSTTSRDDRLRHLYETGESSDIVFEVGSSEVKKFYAHKLIFSMASEHFESWFYQVLPEKLQKLTLKNMEPKHFEILMRFIYTDAFQVNSFSDAISVAYAANRFALHELFVSCVAFIELNLSVENIWEAYDLALQFHLAKLLTTVKNVIQDEQYVAFTVPGFIKCELATVESVTREIGLRLDQRILFIALTKWAKNKVEKTATDFNAAVRQILLQFLPFINFVSLSPQDFAETASITNVFTDEEFTSIALNIVGIINRPLPSWLDKLKSAKNNYDELCFFSF